MARLRVGIPVARSVAPDVPDADSGLLPSVAAGQPVAPSAGDAPPATVLRAVADPALGSPDAADPGIAASSEAGVQRAAGDAAPAAGPAPAGTAGSAGASGPTSGPELDALAARLYERIRLRLRRELLADRERAGVLVDMGR
jgi:hypothetical protein